MKKVVINLSDRLFYSLVTVAVLILLAGGVYAVSGVSHDLTELPSIPWSKLTNVPSGLDDGDDVGVQTLSEVLAQGSDGDGRNITNLGTVYADAFIYTSDERLKDDVVVIDNAVDIVESLEGVSFVWKENGGASIGLIAQDVEDVLPEIVSTGEDGYKGVQYANLVAVLIEAIKEQQREIDDLKTQIDELQ